MFRFLEFFIAYRFLQYKLYRSLLIVLAIAIGIGVQTFVGIILDSTQANLIKRTLGYSPHLTIKPFADDKINDRIKRPEEIVKKIIDDPNIFNKITFVAEGVIVLSDFDRKKEITGRLIGFQDLQGKDIFGLRENLIAGNYSLRNNGAVIGYEIAQKLDLNVGDYFIIRARANKFMGGKVVGIFKSGNQQLDNYVVADINRVQDILGYSRSEFSSIFFQINNVFDSDKIKNKLLVNYRWPYELSEWKESNQQLLRGLAAQSRSGFFVQFFILISIAVSIFSIISMKIVEKYKDIGVLKSLGMQNFEIIKIFVNISFLLGLTGVLLGLVLGLGMINLFLSLTKTEEGLPLFDIVVRFEYLLLTIVFNVLTIMMAGYLSARKVINIEPAKIIIGG
ncbi:MAG: ABC transporter permease [Patescibacteria group bacterium]|nr:ABC transporter permease [Patescibacteria group bacterium]